MYGHKLGISAGLGLPPYADLYAFKQAGFDGFHIGGNRESIMHYAELAKKENFDLQSVHAPYPKTDTMWKEGEAGDDFVRLLNDYVDITADAGSPIMVCHTWIGFDTPDVPNQLGLDRYKKVVDHATERGIQIAFENTEGEEFLAALMDYFKGNETVGFCWDTGHEQCYNHGKDMMALHGDRLLFTHINDNLGIKDYTGRSIHWHDDLHILPFDGIIDWQNVADRLVKHGYKGPLTMELSRERYKHLTVEDYLFECLTRICRIAAMMNRSLGLAEV